MRPILLYLTAFTIVTMLFIGCMSFLSLAFVNTPSLLQNADYVSMNKTFNKYINLVTTANDMQTSITQISAEGTGTLDVLNSLWNAIWSSLKLIPQTFSFSLDAIYGISNYYQIPSYITSLLAVIVIFIIIFTIWATIFRTSI